MALLLLIDFYVVYITERPKAGYFYEVEIGTLNETPFDETGVEITVSSTIFPIAANVTHHWTWHSWMSQHFSHRWHYCERHVWWFRHLSKEMYIYYSWDSIYRTSKTCSRVDWIVWRSTNWFRLSAKALQKFRNMKRKARTIRVILQTLKDLQNYYIESECCSEWRRVAWTVSNPFSKWNWSIFMISGMLLRQQGWLS